MKNRGETMRKKKPRNTVKLSKLFIVGSLFLFALMISTAWTI